MVLAKQRGTALIVALFVVAVVAAIALNMMERLSRDLRRTELLLTSIQAELYAEGSLLSAADTLNYHWQHQQPHQPIDQLPLALGLREHDHYRISSRIEDAQRYFNLNNLSSEDWLPLFNKLLLSLDPQLTTAKAEALTKSIKTRISTHAFVHVSELRLINGITAALYLKLLPYVIVLPLGTLINVNTAPPPVLQSLSPSFTLEGAKALISSRQQKPFSSIGDFIHSDLAQNHALPENKVTVNSEYFLIETEVDKGQQQLLLYTLVQRIIRNGKPVIFIHWQSKGRI